MPALFTNLLRALAEYFRWRAEEARIYKLKQIHDSKNAILTLKADIEKAVLSGRDGNLNGLATLRGRLSAEQEYLDYLSGQTTDAGAGDSGANA